MIYKSTWEEARLCYLAVCPVIGHTISALLSFSWREQVVIRYLILTKYYIIDLIFFSLMSFLCINRYKNNPMSGRNHKAKLTYFCIKIH